MSDVNEWTRKVHGFAVRKGWWADNLDVRIPRLVRWLHEEAEEVLSEWAENGRRSYFSTDDDGFRKPEGIAAELADLVMIAMDIAGGLELDLEAAISTKYDYDQIRRYKRDAHGEVLAEGQS